MPVEEGLDIPAGWVLNAATLIEPGQYMASIRRTDGAVLVYATGTTLRGAIREALDVVRGEKLG